jgi:glycosyltransferase involved in cell wall biosynthesis
MQTPTPRVSIGLPVYNGEKYLREALNSILLQTYTNFELIISDNASVDQTQKICMDFAEKDQRIRYYRNETNLGAAPNHNLVFKLAKGEYFRWAGCDDKISPELLEKCVEFLDNHLDVVLCVPNTGIIGEYGEDLGGFEYGKDISLPTPGERFRYFSLVNTSGNYLYGLIRSNAITKIALHGSYPSSDLVFLAELSLYGKFDVVTSERACQ